MTYVYPVVSRRAGGLSIGVNLNPNAACNWRCAYCQVPGLVRGAGPPIDRDLLRRELDTMLASVVDGDYLEHAVPEPYRRLNDVAFSGDGEPTTSPDFAVAAEIVVDCLAAHGLLGATKVVIITNGSFARRPRVTAAFDRLASVRGEVWFKLDAGTGEDIARINGVAVDPEAHIARLVHTALRIPTWVQTCLFGWDGAPPRPAQFDPYLAGLERALELGAPLIGVYLYTLARPPYQPNADRLSRLEPAELDRFAIQIRALGIAVQVSP